MLDVFVSNLLKYFRGLSIEVGNLTCQALYAGWVFENGGINMEGDSRPSSAGMVGGRLCLDFANTVHCYTCEDRRDDLASYSDLVSWARRAGVITKGGERNLSSEAAGRARKAGAVLKQARALRSSIHEIFSAIAGARAPSQDDLQALNAELTDALSQAQITRTSNGFTWTWDSRPDALDHVLLPVVRSAVDLLMSDCLGRIRECAGETCTWLFMDTSKNRSRRWCDMKGCGNRAKSRRHYERTHRKEKRQH